MESTNLPDTQILTGKTSEIVHRAKAFIINTPQDYVAVAEILKTVKGLIHEVEATFEEPKRTVSAAKDAVYNAEKKHLRPLQEAEAIMKQKLSAAQQEEERKRQQEEARLQDLARKQEEERRLAEVSSLEAQGKKDEADQIMAAPVEVAPVVLEKQTPKVDGVASQTVWKFRIKDAKKIPDEYKMVDEKKIGGVVRAMKGETNIPGVEVYSEKIIKVTA